MSLAETPAYAEQSDVQAAMQETDMAFGDTPLGDTNVEAAIRGASDWFNRVTNAHFYDSNAAASDLISDSPKTASGVQLSAPSSPHPQQGQVFKVSEGVARDRKYPVTHAGQYTRLTQPAGGSGLPYHYVESIDKLEIRELGGDTTDWVAAADKSEGRGEDYYLQVNGNDDFGRAHLFVHAGALGGRLDFEYIATVELTYGLDWQDTVWTDVRRGIGHLAAAELVVDDDVLTALPDDGQLIGVDTEAQQHIDAAMDRYLGDYIEVPVA